MLTGPVSLEIKTTAPLRLLVLLASQKKTAPALLAQVPTGTSTKGNLMIRIRMTQAYAPLTKQVRFWHITYKHPRPCTK